MMENGSNPPNPDRREALRRVALLFGGALVGGPGLLRALDGDPAPFGEVFSVDEVALLSAMAETILPATDTPGATEAGVGPFVALMVAGAYSPEDRQTFLDGFTEFRTRSEHRLDGPFAAADESARLGLLRSLDGEQQFYMDAKADSDPTHWFRMLKELTLLGFFTSEVGCTQVLRYEETPGRFDPCVPYEDGRPAWADHA